MNNTNKYQKPACFWKLLTGGFSVMFFLHSILTQNINSNKIVMTFSVAAFKEKIHHIPLTPHNVNQSMSVTNLGFV